MIKAGALLYAMFLVVVIAIITSSFIMVDYYNNTYIYRVLKQEKIYQNIHSAINYGLAKNTEIPFNENININLFEENENVNILKKSWGAFYQLTASTKWKNKVTSKTALVGSDFKNEEHIAIYLCDQNKPLSLTGKTKIIGDCYLPKKGVERAYIEGKSFSGSELIHGIKKVSNKNLPELNKKLITENQNQFDYNLTDIDSIVDYQAVFNVDSISNDFRNKTLVLYSPYSIIIENKSISGNVIVKSEKNVIIRSSSSLKDILCYSKGIIIESNSSINGQFFASDSIIVENDCVFKYPSVTAVIHIHKNNKAPKIVFGENTQLKGAIFLYKENYTRKKQALISIGEKSEIMGSIYTSEQIELHGIIKGNVFCKNFLLKTPSSVYENHLMDVTINRNDLPEEFVGSSLTEQNNNHQVIKWLN